jgi:polar amino acid transport system permease protein
MTVQSSAYLTDVIRAGIQAIPTGQWQAADALGLATRAKWIDIILPQAAKIVIPPLANVSIGYFKASATLALLSVGELMTVASRVSTYSYKPIETMTVVGSIYLAMGYGLSLLTYRLERVFGGRKI